MHVLKPLHNNIGKYPFGNNYKGYVDDARLHPYALTAAQVNYIYNGY